jgi:hypothetical protein
VAFNNALLDIAKHEAESDEEEAGGEGGDDVLRVEHDEADE